MSASKVPAAELLFPATVGRDREAVLAAAEAEVLVWFDALAPSLRRYACSFGVESEAADDVVQEVFVALFRHLALRRPRQNLRAWLFRVAHHRALKHQARRRRRQRDEADWDTARLELIADPAANPEQRLRWGRRLRRLRVALHAMPQRDRQCLFLRAEGLTYRDIAHALDISLGGVAKALVRAIARLSAADRD
jgi:RNA polymerase sigma-70 factor (ECF subfamily)